MAMAKFFRIAFGLSGDKATIPDASQPDGSVSYEDGWGVDYELDPATEPTAKDVPRDQTNQFYYDVTTALQEYQTFAYPDFITSAMNGGSPYAYDKNAPVRWTDGEVYISLVDANTADPTDATKWARLINTPGLLAIPTTAFEASVADGEAVYWDGTQFDEAVADGTSKQNFIGFADVTNSRVVIAGQFSGLLSGLTPNGEYFLSTSVAGAITSARPAANAVSVGVARTATGIHVNPRLAIPSASQTVAGLTEIATDAEAQAGTDTVRSVTPAGIRAAFNAIGSAPVYACRAWVRTTGTSGVIAASGNVSSVGNPATGRFVVNFTTALPDGNYAYLGTPKAANNFGSANTVVLQKYNVAPSASSCEFQVQGWSSSLANDIEFSAAFFR